jgi:hypothetical protein
MGHRWISERRTVKVLLEPRGAIFAFTMKTYSYLFFVTRAYVGFKKIRTMDRIVALIAQFYPDGL